jgi:hypothetical protein
MQQIEHDNTAEAELSSRTSGRGNSFYGRNEKEKRPSLTFRPLAVPFVETMFL